MPGIHGLHSSPCAFHPGEQLWPGVQRPKGQMYEATRERVNETSARRWPGPGQGAAEIQACLAAVRVAERKPGEPPFVAGGEAQAAYEFSSTPDVATWRFCIRPLPRLQVSSCVRWSSSML
jgi:hypothetical protein